MRPVILAALMAKLQGTRRRPPLATRPYASHYGTGLVTNVGCCRSVLTPDASATASPTTSNVTMTRMIKNETDEEVVFTHVYRVGRSGC
eukprot:4565222-Pleurochrysis_carterae.AAC.2